MKEKFKMKTWEGKHCKTYMKAKTQNLEKKRQTQISEEAKARNISRCVK